MKNVNQIDAYLGDKHLAILNGGNTGGIVTSVLQDAETLQKIANSGLLADEGNNTAVVDLNQSQELINLLEDRIYQNRGQTVHR